MKFRMGLYLCLLCLVVALSESCRRNQPSLVDPNQGPDTELWYAPPESTEYEYLVHLYWRGVDLDGKVSRYIWVITDTIVPGELGWNPAERLRDYRRGRITTRTDSVFSFTAFRNVGGVGLKKNRQAFHIAAIDDRGVIDSSPARIEFVATIDELPSLAFCLEVFELQRNGPPIWKKKAYRLGSIEDTVGMFRPFKITYHGTTTNGQVREYQWFPLTAGIELEGASIWTTDLADTLRDFPNIGALAFPSDVFRLAAKCRDDANAESPVDAGQFKEGVCQIQVNFDPDTEIFAIQNTYFLGGSAIVDSVDFRDDLPDTVPFRSWVRLTYRGMEDFRDSSICTDDTNMCIRYQKSYRRASSRYPWSRSISAWMPTTGIRPGEEKKPGEDNNIYGVIDTTSMNLGSVEYNIRIRSIDEYGKADARYASVNIVGNFDPVLDTFYLKDHMGNVISDGDTITWNWWLPQDSSLIPPPPNHKYWRKRFYFVIGARGHDHPKDPVGSAVKAWQYIFYDMEGNFTPLAQAGVWVEGSAPNALDDTFRVAFQYPFADSRGDSVFAHLPTWINKTYDAIVKGRDTSAGEQFEQYMFVNGQRMLVNSYSTALLGRWTQERRIRFHLRIIRPGV